jgi:hypothetical protein
MIIQQNTIEQANVIISQNYKLYLCLHKVKYKWGKRGDKDDARYRWKESEISVIRNKYIYICVYILK